MGLDDLTYCLECTSPISKTATKCPSCGAINPHGQSSLFGCLSFGLGFLALSFFFNESILAGTFFTIAALFFFHTRSVVKKDSLEKLQKVKTDKATNKTIDNNTSSNKQEAMIQHDKTVMFSYVNALGEVSKNRVVDINRVYRRSGNVYVDGYCRQKEEERTFRLDRIDGEIYIPANAELLQPDEWAAIQDIEEDEGGEMIDNGIKTRIKPVSAPSGFVFPFFPYTEETVVRIYDTTDYRSWMLQDRDVEYKNNFSQEDFDYLFDPTYLDIQVDSFEIMFKPATMKKIGMKPISGLFDLYNDMIYKIEDNEPIIWRVNQNNYKKLINEGMLQAYDIEKNEENVSQYLEQLRVPELKELCKNLNERISKNKQGLISSLLQHKESISIDQMAKPTKKLSDLISKLTNIYLGDIRKQLKDKPSGYGIPVWACVAEDYLLMKKAQDYAKYQLEILQ